ncbi:MAG TPA: hypothetical protein VID27_07075 [Blastocatellia bacterium]|jgi:hypothetical protein
MAEDNALEKRERDSVVEQNGSQQPRLIEVTTFIREDQALALEIIQNAERLRRGEICSQAELFQEALDMLINASLIPIRLGTNRPIKKND